MKITYGVAVDNISKQLDGMVDRANGAAAYLDRVIWRKYKKAQLARWETAGASEGFGWRPVSKDYAKQKEKRYAGFDGAGKVTMVATGKLSRAATGEDSSGIVKYVTNSGITIGINTSEITYAPYPGKARPYMKFSPATVADWRRGLVRYMGTGKGL